MTKCPLIPTRGKCVVEREEAQKRTPGGIELPDTAQEKPIFAKIVAMGSWVITEHNKEVDPGCKLNDRVAIPRWGGSVVEVAGKEYLVMLQADVLAVVAK